MNSVHTISETTAYLGKSSSFVETLFVSGNDNITIDERITPMPVTPVNAKKSLNFIPWGKDNLMPMHLIEKSYKNATVASNLAHITRLSYGDGIRVFKKEKSDSGIQLRELTEIEAPEIFAFLENSNYNRVLAECSADFSLFENTFVEFTLAKNGKKIARVVHKDACYSRYAEANDKGVIENHIFSTRWKKDIIPTDAIATPLINQDEPMQSIDKLIKQGHKRFMLSLSLPTPGRYYYNKPYWWSIFESGWFDFACSIPEFKKSLLKNQLAIRYHIKIRASFWERLFREEKLTTPEKQAVRKQEILSSLDKFLAGAENAGKTYISSFEFDTVAKIEVNDIVIEPIKSNIQGGEYIDDSEEVNNIICYAMGIHPSIFGASPGKNKTISGTEARELFIIKQAMMKPVRDALLLPLYIARNINGWGKDIVFAIPNIMLTTLDRGTGAVKSIGNQEI